MGKSKKRATAPPMTQMMLPQMMMPQMMMPQMMMGAPPVPAAGEEYTSSESESSGARTLNKKQAKQDEKSLTSSAGVLLKLPTKRLKQFVKAIAPELETLIAGEFTNEVLCRMLFCLSGLRPQTRTSNFAVKTFKDCIAKIVTRANFHKKKIGRDAFDKIVSDLIADCLNEDAGAVVEKSDANGFESSWLEEALNSKRKRAGGNSPCQDGNQLTLQDMMINKKQPLALGWVDPVVETKSTASSSWQQWGSNSWPQSDESNWTRGDWKNSHSNASLWGEEHERSEELADREFYVQSQLDRLAEQEGQLEAREREQQLKDDIEKAQRDCKQREGWQHQRGQEQREREQKEQQEREQQEREQHECEQRQRAHLQREHDQKIQQEREQREQEQREQRQRDQEQQEEGERAKREEDQRRDINIDQRNRINQSREAALQRRQLRQANSATEAVEIDGTTAPEVATETITVDVASAPGAISDGGGTVHKCIICTEVLGTVLVLQTLKCMHVFHRSKNSTAMSNTK
jgi:hypothetical protein